MKIIFTLTIIIFLLPSCGCLATNEHLKSSVANEKSESSHMLVEDSQNDNYDIDLESLSSLTLFSEMEYQIKDDIAPLTFKAYSDKENSDYVSALYVFGTETGAPVCNFKISGLWDAPGVSADIYKIEFIDVDFDGYKDIRIFGGSNGNWNIYYIYFIWDSDAGKFIDDPYGLADLGLPAFDEKTQLVHSMQRGSAADHWYYTHKYIQGELVTIEEVSFNLVWEYYLDDSAKEQLKALEPLYDGGKTGFMHYMEKQLDYETMEMVIVANKYMLNTRDGDSLAEYAPDSEVGGLLRSYER